MQEIIPHLWFDDQAVEAAGFYTSIFEDSAVTDVTTLEGTPSGSVDHVSFELCGQRFLAISAGPLFEFNPSVSFFVSCKDVHEVDSLWDQLSGGGTVLMPLSEYPFSERFGWTEDQYGVSWQVMYQGEEAPTQKITPMLMFVGEVAGRAEEAIQHYCSLFEDSGIIQMTRHEEGEGPEDPGTLQQAVFNLAGQRFRAMDSAMAHDFAFNEAISLLVYCDSQEEIDHLWEGLSAFPEAEQCGWLKDRYGVSWQIIPRVMEAMMANGDQEGIARMTRAFLQMKKFDVEALEAAFRGHG